MVIIGHLPCDDARETLARDIEGVKTMPPTYKTFPCPISHCDRHANPFTKKNQRNRHIALQHPALKIALHSPTRTKRIYKCDKCGTLHYKIHHATDCCQTLQGKRALKRESATSASSAIIGETVPVAAPSTATDSLTPPGSIPPPSS